jgi:O-antigen/teichoic acid export membrane protein
MGIVFRQSVKTTIVTSLGALMGLFVVYLSAKFIPKQELGFSRTLLNQAVIGTQLILMGMHTTVYVLIHKYPYTDIRRRILITLSLFTPFILTAFFSVFYFCFKAQIVAQYQPQDIAFVNKYFGWLPLYTLLWGIMTLLEQYLGSQMKVAVSTFVREIVLRLFNISLILLFGYEYIDFDVFIAGSVLVHIIPVIVLWILAVKTQGFGISLNLNALSKEDKKSIFDFAIFHLFLNVSISLLIYIDAVMLAALDKTGMEAAAVYFVAQSIISIYQIPYKALATASTPAINKAYHENDLKAVADLFSRSAINTLIVTMAMGAIIIANLHNAVQVIGEAYATIPLVVLILMIGRTFDMMTGLNNEVLSVSKYYRVNFYISIVLVILIIILNALLIPHWGIYGAAWGSALALFIFNFGKWLFLKNKMQLQPFSVNTIKVIAAGAIATLVGYYLPYAFNPFADTIIRSFIIAILYGGIILYIRPSKDLSEYLLAVKKNKRLF